jgi:hypothetical protein
LNTFGIKFNSVLGELETLLNKSGQFTDTTTLFTKNVLCVSGTDDDFGTGGSDTDFDTGVTSFSKFTSKEFI